MPENITMLELRNSWFPAKFRWNNRVYEIEAVNECQTVAPAHNPSYHFLVRCEGRFLRLTHLMRSNQWLLNQD
ncbi:MAG: hypothetical protein Kow0031_27270 [Anaerolineae bacterium]